jgi:hypothetical protein
VQLANTKALVSGVRSAVQPYFLVLGSAGSGKSTTEAYVAKVLERVWGDRKAVMVTAPTHRAVRVCEAKLKNAGVTAFTSSTLQRLLGLRVTYGPNGEEHFKVERQVTFPKALKVIFVDEVSMVNRELEAHLRSAVARTNFQREWGDHLVVLLFGDPRQLPPVGDDGLCGFFNDPAIPTMELTQVLRHGGEILDLANTTRAMERGRPALQRGVFGGGAVEVVTDRVKFHRMFREQFDPDQLQQYNTTLGLAWTNRRVDDLIAKARFRLFGKGAPQVVPGELLVATKPVHTGGEPTSADNLQVQNGNLVRVTSVKRVPAVTELADGLEVLRITGTLPEENDKRVEFTIVPKDLKPGFDEALSGFRSQILASPEHERSELWWSIYYPLKNFDAPVQCAAGTTVHKSQGGTATQVFVDAQNIDLCKDLDTRNRLFYTAVTRAAERLVIFDPKAS